VTATEQLVKASDAFFIYISTDYVFPGVQGQAPYKTNDKPKPTNIYGQTKLDGEHATLSASRNAVILRVPVLYGETEPGSNHKESAVNVLMDSLQKSQNEKVKMDDWAIRYPTNTADVGRVCADIAKLYLAKPSEDLPEILQFSSEDRMTKYEICQKFSEITGLSLDGLVADKDGGKPGPDGTLRPYDCHLDTSELKKLGIDVSTVDFVAWWRDKVGASR
jgi:S-adenosylmethionine synthetase